MKTASSMRYGGILVDASECNYDSFKNLGLLCPICKGTVFLVKETTRSATERRKRDGSTCHVKRSDISSYFAHHPETDKNIINDCELKSKQITVAERAYLESKAHNQRQKIFHAHFWKILKTSYEFSGSDYIDQLPHEVQTAWIEQSTGSQTKAIFKLNQFINDNIQRIRSIDSKNAAELTDQALQLFSQAVHKKTIYDPNDQQENEFKLEEYLSEWNSTLDMQMQSAISLQAFEFIQGRKQIKILESLVYHSLDSLIFQEAHTAAHDSNLQRRDSFLPVFYRNYLKRIIVGDPAFLFNIRSGVISMLFSTLIHVKWAQQFELLEQKTLSKKTD